MTPLLVAAVVALLAGVTVALSQKAWPVAWLCTGLGLALLSDAGVIPG
ncbi:hypothetical protein GCM10012289_44020 [Nonomuraea cavernae]|uniref:Uncharacterized protein n=1 Tax=Nonomuraea cavernae TaxID=2045107 RepID=A0A917Z5N2_9ACTN|nr:hypothetical protein GCM10012289_44020 [Nonomuraea cavernae]